MKKFFNVISNIILIFLIICLIIVLYSKYVKQESVVKLGKYGILVVLTDSMEPVISKNEMILIKEAEKYDINDIITYKNGENVLITHRVIETTEKGVVTKGDNNISSDDFVNINNIKGKVIFHSKIAGVLVIYIKFIFLLYLAVLLLILLKNTIKKSKN